MDVSKIGPVSLNKINWRSLTAKEIIKYEQQGVDVPLQYLSWAQDFIASIYSDDKTTYEMAKSTPDRSAPTTFVTTEPETESVEDSEGNSTTDESSTTDETETPEENKNAAQIKREELQESGASLRTQARTFTSDSKKSSTQATISNIFMKMSENKSTNEIQNLQDYMENLIAKAEEKQAELKNEIANINNDSSDKTTFAKINSLQQELEKYGTDGQAKAASSIDQFNQIDASLSEQTTIISDAKDFGTETIDIGTELLQQSIRKGFASFIDRIIGRIAITAGDTSVQKSQSAQQTQTSALATNSSNLSQAVGYQGQIESKTGVQATAQSSDTDSESNNDKLNEQNENKPSTEIVDKKEPESEKDVKTAQNDGTDTTDKLSTSIDEILKRKLRRGIPVES